MHIYEQIATELLHVQYVTALGFARATALSTIIVYCMEYCIYQYD